MVSLESSAASRGMKKMKASAATTRSAPMRMELRRRRFASDLRRSIAHHQPGGTRALPAMRQRVLPGLFAAPLSEMRQGREGIRRFRELKPFEHGFWGDLA